MNDFKGYVSVDKILKDRIVLNIPIEYMVNSIKVEVDNLYYYKLDLNLCEIEVSGLVPSKYYDKLIIKIYYTNDDYYTFYTESFKTLVGNYIENMMVNFYEKFLDKHIPESRFNYWNNKIIKKENSLENFCLYIFNINRFFINKLSNIEFLKNIYTIIIADDENDLLSYWTFYFEFKLKNMNEIDRRKTIFIEMFREYILNSKLTLEVC